MVVILLWRDKLDKNCTASDYDLDLWRDKTSATTRTGDKCRIWCERTVRGVENQHFCVGNHWFRRVDALHALMQRVTVRSHQTQRGDKIPYKVNVEMRIGQIFRERKPATSFDLSRHTFAVHRQARSRGFEA